MPAPRGAERARADRSRRRSRGGRDRTLVVDPDEFYILASREAVRVPADHAAEMLAYDSAMGEFRLHYAGFFHPGFGHAEASGEATRAMLEVRSHEVPFVLEDRQRVGRLIYGRLIVPRPPVRQRHRLLLPAPGPGAQ